MLVLLLPMNLAVLPVIFYLVPRLIRTVLIWGGIYTNPHMAGVIQGKTSAQFPGSTAPSQKSVVVIKLAARSNHPLGFFHPHMRAISNYFRLMIKELDDQSERYDYLGANTYIGAERASNNETMIIAYFRTYEGLSTFSHAPGGIHRQAWSYWSDNVMGKGKSGEGQMFSILHETYEMPAGHWENIYVNCQPTGLGATLHKVEVDSRGSWASPLVDARKGVLSTSKGRMGASAGNDKEVHGHDPYTNEED